MKSVSTKQRRINSELAKIKKTLGTRCAICGREGHASRTYSLARSTQSIRQTHETCRYFAVNATEGLMTTESSDEGKRAS